MIPLIVIRPEPGCSATLRAARDAGLPTHGFPLFLVEPVAWDAPAGDEVDAVLIGSANALRHGGPGLALYAGKPVYAVGQATAEAAHGAGFAVAAIGSGGLQGVLDRDVPGGITLLRLAGEERVPLVIAPGIKVISRVAYRSQAQPLGAELSRDLSRGALVLLHSAAAARHFAQECDRLALPRTAIRLAALGPRIADAAGDGWGMVRSAAAPNDAALLALADEMCH